MRNIRQLNQKIIIVLLIALYALPLIGDLLINGWPRVFSYFAADAFFYTTVARHFSELNFFTFDGIYPTNGFHPMWQLLLGAIYKFLNVFNLSDPPILISVLIICVLIIIISLLFIALALKNYYGAVPASILIIPLGIYPLIMSFWEPRFGTLWSFSNGMETPLVILSFSILIYFLSKDEELIDSRRSMIILGILNGLMTLSRLDHGLLSLAFFAVLFLYAIRSKKSLKGLMISSFIWIGIIFLFVVINKLSSGMWLPVSGTIKSTFPSLQPFFEKIRDLRSLIQRRKEIDFGWWIWRYCQIVFPCLVAVPVAVTSIIRIFRNQTQKSTILFAAMALFVLSLGFYNFTFVPIFDQGHWYFPLSILFMSLVFIHMINDLRIPIQNRFISSIFVTVVLSFFIFVYWNPNHNDLHRQFYLNASEVITHFPDSDMKMIEYDDGIITYSTNITAMSGFGFCLDNEAAEALKRGELLDLAYDRGYRYISSLYYFGNRFDYSTSSDVIKNYFKGRKDMIGQNILSPYSFEVVYKSLGTKRLYFHL